MLSKIINKVYEVIRNYHLWIISVVILTLTVFYSFWPWINGNGFRNFALFEFENKIVGSLFIIPFIYAFFIYQWRGILAIWLVITAILLPRLFQINLFFDFRVKNIIILFISLAIAIAISLAIRWYKEKIQREVEHQVYMSQIIQAQEDERLRLAQELHDDTIQKLLATANRAQTLLADSNNNMSPLAIKNATSIRDSILDVTEDLRKLSSELRPTVLDTLGLVHASISMVDNFNSQCDTDISIAISGKERKLSSIAEVTIFRIIQEALNNIMRHAEAKHATVSLKYALSSVNVLIQDDGCGFSMPATLGHFVKANKLGITGIRERVRLLGGSFVINSSIGSGTSIKVKVKC